MQKRIYKYMLESKSADKAFTRVPIGSKLLKVAGVGDQVYAWYEVSTEFGLQIVDHVFEIVPTGGTPPVVDSYLDTVFVEDLVFHLYASTYT